MNLCHSSDSSDICDSSDSSDSSDGSDTFFVTIFSSLNCDKTQKDILWQKVKNWNCDKS